MSTRIPLAVLGAAVSIVAPVQPPPGEILVTVNGERIFFAGQGPTLTADGSVLVPLRGIFEKLGAGVRFDPDSKTIVAVRGATTVALKLGEAQGLVNGEVRALATPAQSVGGTTLVPLRFVSEAFGADVRWTPAGRTVAIVSGGGSAAIPTPDPEVNSEGALIGTVTQLSTDARAATVRLASGNEVPVALVDGAGTVRVGDRVRLRGGKVEVIGPDTTGSAGTAPKRDLPPPSLPITEPTVVEAPPVKPVGIEPKPEPPAAPVRPAIDEVAHDLGARWAKPGETVLFTVRGTPGAKGTVRLPGIPGTPAIVLAEETGTPGVYTGRFTVPQIEVVPAATAVAELVSGDLTSPPVASAQTIALDGSLPQIGAVSPADGARTSELRPQFSGTWSDLGSGIDARACRLTVAGGDVSGDAVFTAGFFSYKPQKPLALGEVPVALTVRDVAGNETVRMWTVTIVAPDTIRSVAVEPSGRPLDFGDIVSFKLEGIPGAAVSVQIGALPEQALREGSPGNYVGSYTVRRDDAVSGASVLFRVTPPGGKTVTRAAPATITMTAGAPDPPVIDLPQEGASVGGSVVLSGRSLPNALVRLSVRYSGRKVVVAASGEIVAFEVKADRTGSWVTPPVVLKTPRDVSQVTFTAVAIAVGTGGSVSSPATVRFKR